MTARDAQRALRAYGSPSRASHSQKFFRTEKGSYGYGDVFVGATVPEIRRVARTFRDLSLPHLKTLLASKVHEDRLAALIVLGDQFGRAEDAVSRRRLVGFYLAHRSRVNNWDLVDLSAPRILGEWLKDRPRARLVTLGKSKSLWDRRIAIVSTLAFIRDGETADVLKISAMLLGDKEDLIHKAVGWMLREAWKRSPRPVEVFLRRNIRRLPRTSLRYAIERMAPDVRAAWLRL